VFFFFAEEDSEWFVAVDDEGAGPAGPRRFLFFLRGDEGGVASLLGAGDLLRIGAVSCSIELGSSILYLETVMLFMRPSCSTEDDSGAFNTIKSSSDNEIGDNGSMNAESETDQTISSSSDDGASETLLYEDIDRGEIISNESEDSKEGLGETIW
jgi:hypothetical protein